jgi:hypothetical protein
LKQKEVNESHKTLGCYKCIVGKENDQFHQLLFKSNKIAEKIQKGQLNHRQSRIAYGSCYIPSMVYSLTAVSMDESQLIKIQQKATSQFTRMCGFEMTFPKAVVYGPVGFGGLGFQNLYVESNVNKIETIICHMNQNSPLGEKIRMILNWIQLHTGVEVGYLENQNPLLYIQNTWFTEVRRFLIKSNAKMKIKSTWAPKKLRQKDSMIMDYMESYNTIKQHQTTINNWRIYFQVNSIAELLNYSGNKIQSHFLEKTLVTNYRSRSSLRWPIQQIPHISTLQIWVKYILYITKSDKNGIIGFNIGYWADNICQSIKVNEWIHQSLDHLLVKDQTGKWCKHIVLCGRQSTSKFEKVGNRINHKIEFNEYIPVDIESTNLNNITVKTRNRSVFNQIPKIIHVKRSVYNMEEYFVNMIHDPLRLLDNTTFHDNSGLENTTNLRIRFCSDGGVRFNTAGFGMIGSIDNNTVITNKQRLPAIYNDYTSHRSEAFGILSAINTLKYMQEFMKSNGKQTNIQSTLICDNKSVVDTLNKFRYTKMMTKDFYNADHDIINEIVRIRKQIYTEGVKTNIIHIKGHQDKTNKILSEDAILNVAADKLATESLSLRKNTSTNITLSETSLFINQRLVTSEFKTTLRKNYLSMDLREYLELVNDWHSNEADMIWWDVHATSLYSMGYDRRRVIQKFIHKKLPCNYRQNMYYSYKSASCKSCNHQVETQLHVLTCQGCSARSIIKQKFTHELKGIMEKHRIDKATMNVILHNVTNYLYNRSEINAKSIAPEASKTLILATHQQQKLGWDQWFKGRWTKEWSTLFDHDIQNNDSGIKFNTAERIANEIIQHTWEFVSKMWRERNKVEHDEEGEPEVRKKEKVIEIIKGISEMTHYPIYSEDEINSDTLLSLPLDNLKMIEINLKNARERKRKEK